MVVRGVPHKVANDAWWLDDTDPPQGLRAWPVLLVAIILADWMMWGATLGLGLGVWFLIVSILIAAALWRKANWSVTMQAGVVLVLGLLPLIEVVQFSSMMFAILGLLTFTVLMAGAAWDGTVILRAIRRLPGYGMVRTAQDALGMRVSVPSKGGFRGAIFDWALPLGVGALFLILFAAANPLVDKWMLYLSQMDADFLPSGERFFFWMLLAIMVWPLLRVSLMMPSLTREKPVSGRMWRSGFVNERSVVRALVVFNVIFLTQTTLDLGYLWGGFALPDGMTYAGYAHRGAYPLLATALLAGLFALLSQPYLGERGWVRGLLYVWIGQTVILVISSILRLDLYVDVYGFTRLRFAAFVWMAVVALGLVLMIMQMVGRESIGWFLQRAFGLGLLALYGCSLVDIDGFIARNNLADQRQSDFYICELSEGAAPALAAYEKASGNLLCDSSRPSVSQPDDWREWGYRNMRLRRSLAALEDTQ
jgi:hypothetical protein